MKIIMLGAPGAGKGTQAKMIAEKCGIPHISTGDIFRANIKNGTELGAKAKEYMDKGLLVPDELVCDLVVDRIQQADCEKGYILDGFPRTIPQAEALENALNAIEQKLDYAIDGCGATYHVLFNPTKVEGKCDVCGESLILRDDDKPETVKKRLDVYHTQTQPLIDFYTERKVLVEVDGTQSMDKVFDDIMKILGE